MYRPNYPVRYNERFGFLGPFLLGGITGGLIANSRPNNFYPVFVPLNDKSCGGCMMELPSASVKKLKDKHKETLLDLEKQGKDIKILNIANISVLADYFVICQGGSTTQIKAIADEVEEKLYKEVELPLSKVLADMQYEGITIDKKQLFLL